jgi:hypothetical protein
VPGIDLLLALLPARLLNFLVLTGRVVDQANIIPPTAPDDRARLADLEAKSASSLSSPPSRSRARDQPFANQLFRA